MYFTFLKNLRNLEKDIKEFKPLKKIEVSQLEEWNKF